MKKLILFCFLFIVCAKNTQMVAQSESGIFNSLAVGASVGTTGIGIDLATPIGNYVAVRAGVSFMPNISFDTNVDVDIETAGLGTLSSNMDVEGALKRASGDVFLNSVTFNSFSRDATAWLTLG